jgi:hypothetical protein
MDKVANREAQVSQFIEENWEVLEDPELGPDAAQRLAIQTVNLLVPLMNEVTDTLNDATKAANLLADAINDPHCSAGEVNEHEKEHRRLGAKRERLQALQDRLLDFHQEVGCARPEDRARIETRVPVKIPWWKRLLGVHQEESSEPRESTLTPSQVDSDREDYEKLLTWYEQNLEVLEKAVAGRQRGEPGDWHQVIDELLGNMNWCDRNMDAIEQRNVEIAGSGLVTERRDLFARYLEISS